MGIPFLISLDPHTLSLPASAAGLSLTQISYFGRVFLKSCDTEQAIDFIRRFSSLLDVYIDTSAIENVGDVVEILDSGASKALVTPAQLTTLSREQTVPPSRLIISLSCVTEATELQNWIAENDEREEISVHCVDSPDVGAIVSELGDKGIVNEVYRSYEGVAAAIQATLASSEAENVVTIIPSIALSLDKDDISSAARLLVARTTPDASTGLYATVVTDERGIALGQVYSSERSISEALKTGTGVYQSRKRGLWYKGQSSGDTQELVRIDFDCDSDCLLFVVKQKGKGILIIIVFFWYCFVLLTSFLIQDSVIWELPLASASTEGCHAFRRPYKLARRMRLLDLTLLDFSRIRSSSRQRLWRRLRSCAMLLHRRM